MCPRQGAALKAVEEGRLICPKPVSSVVLQEHAMFSIENRFPVLIECFDNQNPKRYGAVLLKLCHGVPEQT